MAYPFFISFLLLYLVVILPLLLGIVLDGYAKEHIRQLDRCRRKVRVLYVVLQYRYASEVPVYAVVISNASML